MITDKVYGFVCVFKGGGASCQREISDNIMYNFMIFVQSSAYNFRIIIYTRKNSTARKHIWSNLT